MITHILVIGETCCDIFYYGKCERLAPEAPAPVFNPVEMTSNPGMAMNVQQNIMALGYQCDLSTNDNWREVTKTRFIHNNTNQMFLRVDESDDKISRCDVKSLDLSRYQIIVISDYCKGFLMEEDIQYIAANHDCVFLDTKKKLGPWCEKATFIKINNHEYDKSKDTLSETIKRKLIVTLGDKGCQYRDKIYGVHSVDIKDVSGAGDTFLSGLVVKYLLTKNIEESLVFANDCATSVVQRRGVSTV